MLEVASCKMLRVYPEISSMYRMINDHYFHRHADRHSSLVCFSIQILDVFDPHGLSDDFVPPSSSSSTFAGRDNGGIEVVHVPQVHPPQQYPTSILPNPHESVVFRPPTAPAGRRILVPAYGR